MESFEAIYKDNSLKVFSFIFSITKDKPLAEDLTQETFIRAYKNLSTFRQETKLNVWLNKIAYNIFVDFKRKKSSSEQIIEERVIVEKLVDLRKDLSKEVEQRIMSECVEDKLFQLPENYRIPLFLDSHDYSNEEIAKILNCTLANAKVRLHRARKKMKDILNQECKFYSDERNVLC